LAKANSLGEPLVRKVDQALYTLGQAPNWEPGATVKGLFRDGFKTLGTAGEGLIRAETLDEASGVTPQLTQGTTTVDQGEAMLLDLQGEYPDFDCP
jgi:hypothetical protein